MTQALSPVVSECDVFDIGRARVAPGLLRAFNDAC